MNAMPFPPQQITGAVFRKLLAGLLVLALLAAIFVNPAQVQSASGSLVSSPPAVQEAGIAQDSATGTTIFLPAIYHQYPYPSIFGIETSSMGSSSSPAIAQAGAYFVRVAPFSWADIEPLRTDPPTYHWETVNEAVLKQASVSGLRAIATVKYTPSWAQKIPGVACGPMAQPYLDEFAQFLGNLVARYSAPPYNIQYWEIGNEVDVDPSLVPPDSIYGCWGDQHNKYYGGQYYGQMLQYVYPAIKAADPQAQVMLGGLLVNCDPTNASLGIDCKPSMFLEGILKFAGGSYFDIVSFHAFAFYMNGQITEDLGNWQPRGGVVLGKVSFLREVMARYGVDKPLILSEASLLCPEGQVGCSPASDAFKDAQATYVGMLYTRTWAANLLGTVWFTLEAPGWRNSGLTNASAPRPAYKAYQFLATELRGASLVGSLDQQYAGLNGYEFSTALKKIWVLWAPDQADHLITLPANVIQVYDKLGSPVTPAGNQVTVNGTVIIEMTP
jgi:hypothetical protein